MLSKVNNQPKPKIILTRLNRPELTGEQFRVDNVMNISIPYSLPFKSGDVFTTQEVNKLINSNKYTVFRVQAEELPKEKNK